MTVRRELAWDLRLGRWQDVLADVEGVDAIITDPPYSARTHAGQSECTRGIGYGAIGEAEIAEVVEAWVPRCRGWWIVLTDHVLAPAWEAALGGAGLYAFSPLACVSVGSRVRLAGDGPSQWSVWAVVARPRREPWCRWGALPGAYVEGHGQRADDFRGGKSEALMRAIVRDYSRPWDIVCDPYAGRGTTLLAAALEGRRAIGAEADPGTHGVATLRLQRAAGRIDLAVRQMELLPSGRRGRQLGLGVEGEGGGR